MTKTSDIINILLPVMRTVGDAILHLQKIGFTVERKSNNDIVTKADLLANEILKTELQSAFPDYGWLSEESVDNPERLACQRVWIVDPIDGTKEFATGIPEYAISVALVEKGVPIVAAVYNPAAKKLFHAQANAGAFLEDTRIYCRKTMHASRLVLLASRSEYKKGRWEQFMQHDVQPVGSIAYKLGLIAEGVGDATFSLSPKNEWDIAAGVLLVQEAGGMVATRSGERFVFNRKKVLVDSIVATSAVAKESVFKLINT